MIEEQLHRRISHAEDSVRRIQAAPTVPIIDPTNQPQDPLDSQIVIGVDDSINWYDGASWNTHAASVISGTGPQDPLEGQVAIGSDNSLCWYSNAAWRGAAGQLAVASGSLPQDPLEGQLVVGSNSIIWFSNGDWYGFA
jgi:hypothetical protein